MKERYPILYNIAHKKQDTVLEVLSYDPSNLSFRRFLVGDKLEAWQSLLAKITEVDLNEEPDLFRWALHQSGQFSVQSMYRVVLDSNIIDNNRYLWRLKVPLKIQKKNLRLTKDNLIRRNWHENEKCCFCSSNETIQYLFLIVIWPNSFRG